jgi:phosphoglycerol transferase MdoB-like AlkP superfamily enzyme
MTISNSPFNGFRWRGNLFVVLILRLCLVMILFSACRVGFYLYNAGYFPEMTFGTFLSLMRGGLVFDLVTLLYFNALYILLMIVPTDIRFRKGYQNFLRILFFITNGFALVTNVADFIYYQFTLRRTTADVLLQFENETNMAGLWFKFIIDYWYAVLFWVFIMIALVWLYNRLSIQGPQMKNRIAYYIGGALSIPLIAYLMIGGIRGGFAHSTRPITLSNAGEYVKDPKHISIVLNTPFAVIRTMGKTKVKAVKYYDDEEVQAMYPVEFYPNDTSAFQPLNVVVIILESFSKEFFGVYNSEKENGTYKGYTPFLDSLARHSLTFEHSFANGRKSIDGLPSVVSSIPSLGVPYFLSPYSGNRINSLASLLGKKGYHTSFFHGAPNGSMGFQAFMNLAGVKEYYGMNDYKDKEDYDGIWGIWDDKFLRFYGNKLNSFKPPFFSAFFSLSSHHPFKVPDEYEGKFKGGPLVIHKCIQYTDHSLKMFFEQVKQMPWYNNTLFVITADHTSSEIQFAETRTAWGFYSVPVMYFKPDNSLARMDGSITQQADIMPSVLGYLKYDEPFFGFGRNIFSSSSEPCAFQFKDNAYQLMQKNHLLLFDGTKSVALYAFKTDKLLQENLLTKHPEIVAEMEKKIKVVIQQYNNRLIENRMTVQ